MMIRLPWYDNGDRLQVAITANAAARAGYSVFRVLADSSQFEKGDYLIDAPDADTLSESGLSVQTCSPDPSLVMQEIVAPRIALLAGACSAYPYYGYYALALLRLGYVFTIVYGGYIARGALDAHDLLVLPGAFPTGRST